MVQRRALLLGRAADPRRRSRSRRPRRDHPCSRGAQVRGPPGPRRGRSGCAVPSVMASSLPSGRAQRSAEHGVPSAPRLWKSSSPFGLRATRAESPSWDLSSTRSPSARHCTTPVARSTAKASTRARSGRSGSSAVATAHTDAVGRRARGSASRGPTTVALTQASSSSVPGLNRESAGGTGASSAQRPSTGVKSSRLLRRTRRERARCPPATSSSCR
jgi:hypothetical protein